MLSSIQKLSSRLPFVLASKSRILSKVSCRCCAHRLKSLNTVSSKEVPVNNKEVLPRKNTDMKMLFSHDKINEFRTRNKFYSSDVGSELDFYSVNDIDEGASSNNLRNFLFPATKDNVIVDINNCNSIQEVFDIIDKMKDDELKVEHLCQSLLVLWDLQRQFCTSDYLAQFLSTKNSVFKSYVNQIHSHSSFKRVLTLIDLKFEELSENALACMVLYLLKMGLELREPLIRKMVCRMEDFINNCKPGELSLSALSRFSVALCFQKTNDDLWAKCALISVMPHLVYWNEACETVEDFKLVTICMWSILEFAPRRLIDDYHSLVERFLSKDAEILPGSLVKCAFVLDPPSVYNNPYRKTIVRVLRLLQDRVNQLNHVGEFLRLNKVFIYHSEPSSLRVELRDNCQRWLKRDEDNDIIEEELSCALFYCLALNTPHSKRYRLASTAAKLVECTDNVYDLLMLASGQLRTVMQSVYSSFWPKVLAFVKESGDDQLLTAVAFRYVEVMSTKRCVEFENEVLEMLFELLDRDSVMGPSRLAQVAMCTLSIMDSSAHVQYSRQLTALFERVFAQIGRFSIFDTASLSRGLMRVVRQGRVSDHLPLYIQLEKELSATSLEFLDDKSLSLYDINLLCRGLINRTQFNVASSPYLSRVLERYRDVDWSEISSRSLRYSMFNLVRLHCCVPPLLSKMVAYVVQEADNVTGSTVSLLLHGLYKLGYLPDDDRFYEAVINATIKDADMMAGLALLQTALALAWANRLPSSLIQAIFDVDFLNDLDHEIKFGYSKISYPIRVRRCLMKLNRSVCLDFPEAGVPWFHADFCRQEDLLHESKVYSPLKQDVEKILNFLAGRPHMIGRDIPVDYGYKLDFQVNLDKNNRIIPYRKGADPHTKVAVLLGDEADWSTSGVQRTLRGAGQMRRRHLEILGFRVALVDQFVWSSMFMTEPSAKVTYLSNLIVPSS
ncbi:FAST kinase domain-containing protein 1, mitochondrial isoform X1 [Nilaparvata lugens]|uniref:FAST kinase domain-containing protein 1, mitochondrial isoform X1 n=1 Tax=Nilaparvata lugens TaxID=108931 RepID=UPI00193E8660|nr:FAST kinase domain-containing protein 1, mitochondrial isoform X1 [Nilaparvata lugens]